jgi:hypothetical protein
MLHQVTSAIRPALSLRDTFTNWHVIRDALAESSRKRMLQVQKMAKTS